MAMAAFCSGVPWKNTSRRAVQPSKTNSSIVVTAAGRVMLPREVQFSKALSSRVFTLSGITMSVREEQPENA